MTVPHAEEGLSIGRAGPPEREGRRGRLEEQALGHMDALYRAALRMTKDQQDAEDLVQDTYLRVFRFLDRFQEGTNLRAWLFKILTNTYINTYRKKVKEPRWVEIDRMEEDDVHLFSRLQEYERQHHLPSAEEEFFRRIVDEDVRRALEGLPGSFRLPVLLADIEEFSYKEIAEILGIPMGTVMSRLYRGRRLLEKALWDYAQKGGFGAPA